MTPQNEHKYSILTVKITSEDTGESSTGFILSQPHLDDKVYVFTAKHCVCGREFTHNPVYSSLSFEINQGENRIKYSLQESDRILFNKDVNEPDIAVFVINKTSLEEIMGNIPFMKVVMDRQNIQGCVIGGYPNEFELKSCKTISCSFDSTGNKDKIELSPQSRIETVEFDENLDSIRGMSGGSVVLEYNSELFFHGIIDEFGGWERFSGTTIAKFNDLLILNEENPLEVVDLELDAEVVSGIKILNTIGDEELERRRINNKIGTIHLDRKSLIDETELLLNGSDVLIINGNAGVGKSVVSSIFLETQSGKKSVFVFRSDELLSGTLSSFLTSKGINISLEQILDSPILLGDKIIYLDAIENILEAQRIDAVESILNLVQKRTDVKILISVRSKYIDKLTALLGNVLPKKRAFIEVPLLSDNQIDLIISEYNWMTKLYQNPKLEELLRIPFYVNHTISLSKTILDEGEISKRNLIIKLWQKIVVNNNLFRESAFESIVVERAKEMKPYIKPTFLENVAELIEAMSQLTHDEVVLSDEDDYGDLCYAPAHDIFQDWALVRHVNKLKNDIPELLDFLKELGNELAIRRGFRLWMSDQLDLRKHQEVNNYFLNPTKDCGDDLLFWKDEIIFSILRSDQLSSFIESCKDQFLEDSASLFKRFTRLLLISTHPIKEASENNKEGIYIDRQLDNSWRVIITFLDQNFGTINPDMDWMVSFFENWSRRPKIKLDSIDENEVLKDLCKSTMITLEKSEFPNKKISKEILLDAYIQSSISSSKELELLLTSAIEFEEENNVFRTEWRRNPDGLESPSSDNELKGYFKGLLNRLLSGHASIGLCRLHPNIVLDYNKNYWKEDDPVISPPDRYLSHRESIESEFGLSQSAEYKYFPASPYQTPIIHLLRFYPIETVKFICNFFNEASEKYAKNMSKYREDEIEKIKIIGPDGVNKTFIGSSSIWSIFRGTVQASPYLLQSLLMSLEKHLLLLSSRNDRASQLLLNESLSTIYEYSSCVSTLAVVSSVCIAHPQPISIKKFILPLFSVKNFFYWDISRLTGESGALAPVGDSPIIQEERYESNQLPHRKELLESFLIRLSLTTIMAKDIFEILDYHYSERNADNDNWSLMLNRMDVRKFEIIDKISEKNQIEIKPKLDKELESTVKRYEEESSGMNKAISSLNWAVSIISRGDQTKNIYKTWSSYFNGIQTDEKIAMFDSSAGLAFIGLRYHVKDMNSGEKKGCIEIIVESAKELITLNEFGEPQISNTGVHTREPVLLGLPEVLSVLGELDNDYEIKKLLLLALIGLNFRSGADQPLFEKISNRIWSTNSGFATNIFNALFHIKEVILQRPKHSYQKSDQDLQDISNYREKHEAFIGKAIKGELKPPNLEGIELTDPNLFFLNKTFLFIPDSVKIEQEQLNYLVKYTNLVQESTLVKYQRHEEEGFDLKMLKSDFQKKFALIVLNQPQDISNLIFTKVLNFILDKEGKLIEKFTIELYTFINDCLKAIIIEQDQRITNTSFWNTWYTLFNWNRDRMALFPQKLLLDIAWNDRAIKWDTMHGKSEFFQEVVNQFGDKQIKNVVKLISRIGFEELGLDLVPIVAKLSRDSGFEKVELQDSELWMQRLFNLRRAKIISDQKILEDVVYILNQMIDRKSSIAFHIRDVLISYLKNN